MGRKLRPVSILLIAAMVMVVALWAASLVWYFELDVPVGESRVCALISDRGTLQLMFFSELDWDLSIVLLRHDRQLTIIGEDVQVSEDMVSWHGPADGEFWPIAGGDRAAIYVNVPYWLTVTLLLLVIVARIWWRRRAARRAIAEPAADPSSSR